MTHELERVHGIPFKKLDTLVNRVWSEGEDTLVLFSENLGGWSNINILGQVSIGKVVLKLPSYIGSYYSNPYLEEFKICDFLSRQQLCPTPLATGFLDENARIPYILYRYVEGLVYDSLTDISDTHFKSIRKALSRLSKIKPPNIQVFSKPSTMIQSICKALEFSSTSLEKVSQNFCKILSELKTLCYKLMDISDSSSKWNEFTIHGDLQESNVVFQDDRAIFLDLGSCSIAEPLYDIAYFLVQPPGPTLSCPTEFMLDEEELDTIEILTPIALLSVTTWTLNRLINQELGLVEENLVSPQTTRDMLSYLQTKLSEIHGLVDYWK